MSTARKTACKTIESSPSTTDNKSRKVAIALAFAGALPIPLPIAWIHKFYLGQYLWGIVYLVLAPTGLPKIACCLEGLWYVSQNDEDFNAKFPSAHKTLAAVTGLAQVLERDSTHSPNSTHSTIANPAAAIRDLDQLRQEGLITEYEFEQKRRQLLDQIT